MECFSFLRDNSQYDLTPEKIIPYDPLFVMSKKNFITEHIWKQAQRSFYVGWTDMQFVVKRLHWADPTHALVFLNKYLASRWLWLSPLMEPLVGNIKQVDTLQTTYTVSALKLYIPPYLSHESAMCVNRLRRRAAQVLALADPKFRWVHLWVSRKWGYLGHLLRKGDTHPCKRILFSCEANQAIGRPWNSYIRWGRKTVGRALGLPSPSLATNQQLQEYADNREGWKNASALILQHYEYGVSHISESLWPDSRAPFKHGVKWLLTVWVSTGPHGMRLCWIDTTEGVQQFGMDGSFTETLLKFRVHSCMCGAPCPFVYQFLLNTDMLEEHLHEVHDITRDFSRNQVVAMFEVVPSSWDASLGDIFRTE